MKWIVPVLLGAIVLILGFPLIAKAIGRAPGAPPVQKAVAPAAQPPPRKKKRSIFGKILGGVVKGVAGVIPGGSSAVAGVGSTFGIKEIQ